MKKGNVNSKKYRESKENKGTIVFCGSQGCCPEGVFTPEGGLNISDKGVKIAFDSEQVVGLREALNDRFAVKE